MSKFNPINPPFGWEESWTKYPHGYTIYEALLDWLKQVNDLTENVNDWNTYLDAFVATFDENLKQEVTETVQSWIDSGYIEAVISAALQTQIDDVELQLSDTILITATDGEDITSKLADAITKGRKVRLPRGTFICDEITLSSSCRGLIIEGNGFYHYSNTAGTNIKAKNVGQNSIFKLENGADGITFKDLKLDGDNKSSKCIDASFGAFLTLKSVGVYRSKDFGVYSLQGLARVSKCFFASHEKVGFHCYSDSSITDSEFTGGTIPLLIVAGGNRLVNVWSNSGSESCITLKPFDDSTTHINTSMINIYVGEVYGGSTSKPIIDIVGTPTQYVQQVQISNSHIVCATGSRINGGISLKYARNFVGSNIAVLGFGSYATSSSYMDYFIKTENSEDVSVNNCSIKGVGKNPVWITVGSSHISVSDCSFFDWGRQGIGVELSAIRSDIVSALYVSNCRFIITSGDDKPYCLDGQDPKIVGFSNNYISYINTEVGKFTQGTLIGTFFRLGNNVINSQAVINTINTNGRGQAQGGGGQTVNLFTLPNSTDNQHYLLTVMQSGAGVNSTSGIVNASGTLLGVITTGNTNSNPVLQNTFTLSGNTIQMVVGSGYGTTTWDWAYIRIG